MTMSNFALRCAIVFSFVTPFLAASRPAFAQGAFVETDSRITLDLVPSRTYGNGWRIDDDTLTINSTSTKALPPYQGSTSTDSDAVAGTAYRTWNWTWGAAPLQASGSGTARIAVSLTATPYAVGGASGAVDNYFSGNVNTPNSGLPPATLTRQIIVRNQSGAPVTGFTLGVGMNVRTGVECYNVGKPASATATAEASLSYTGFYPFI